MSAIAFYKKCLGLKDAVFSRIEHEDAMVAVVYKVTQSDGRECILKISARSKDYFREVYFLTRLSNTFSVPHLIQVVPPEEGVHGAILMECLPGELLKSTDLIDSLAYELGSLLAKLHLNRLDLYGDLIEPENLSSDPRVPYTLKFEEGLEECRGHLPETLIDQCRSYFDAHVSLLELSDGPCIVHRDFRPGNIIIYKGKLQGVIDWASARSGFAQEDFVPMEHEEWFPSAETKKAFFAGYASIRPLPDYRLMLPLLRLGKAIATIGFTVKNGTWDTAHARIYQFNRRFLETLF